MENKDQISLEDLTTVKDLLDLAATRGAFRGSELRTVGEIYDKISKFLEAIFAQAQADLNEQNKQQGEV
jgi:hypothetical protein